MSETGGVASRRIYTGRVLNLDIDTVRFPDGSVGDLEMIRHSGASAVVPFLSEPSGPDPQLLLIRQYRHAADGFLYEVPAGRLGPGEAPEACAERELLEETGCTTEQLKYLTTIYTTPGFTDERIHLFIATGLIRGPTRHESDEFITVEAMSMSQALSLIAAGAISDAKTALAILMAAGYSASK